MKSVASRVNLLGIGVVILVIALWELLVATGIVHLSFLPTPVDVARSFGTLSSNGELWHNLGHTTVAAVEGWAIAAVVGGLLGLLLALVTPIWRYSMATIEVLRAIPIVAFVPVAVLIFGFTSKMEIVLAFYAAVWPIVVNTVVGVAGTSAQTLDVGRAMHLSKLAQIWSLRLPDATATIVVGLRLGLSLSLVLVIVSELTGNPAGIGYAIAQAGQSLHSGDMVAYIISVGILGLLFNTILVGLARILFRGQMAAAGDQA